MANLTASNAMVVRPVRFHQAGARGLSTIATIVQIVRTLSNRATTAPRVVPLPLVGEGSGVGVVVIAPAISSSTPSIFVEYLVVPKSQDAVAIRFKCLRSVRVGSPPAGMLAAIDFNNQTRGMAGEVGDVLPDSNLAAEMGVGQLEPMAQVPPELALRFGWLGTHLAREFALPW